ncbi:CBS domain-containing protein [Streptomyces sp. NRRL S-920]|uniref:CBS domain-containing protein n=1 Tax=Streptomyces sp. NRRL S-920 TaxID=1463921 RepID=UPI0004C6AB4C|nr:CBS domain-containing protein [Streptomyces sp. NRRL S-920]
MTLVQTQHRSADATPVHGTVADAIDPAGPRVGDDMTVEVALSVMAGARTEHLLVCDDDGLCTGLVTRARLVAVRDGSAYTDRVQLRDIPDLREPFTSPVPVPASVPVMADSAEGGVPDVLVLAR